MLLQSSVHFVVELLLSINKCSYIVYTPAVLFGRPLRQLWMIISWLHLALSLPKRTAEVYGNTSVVRVVIGVL